MEPLLQEQVVARVEGRPDPHDRDIRLLGPRGALAVRGEGRIGEALGVDPRVGCGEQRQRLLPVDEHRDRLRLGPRSGLSEGGVADDPLRGVFVDVGIVEQAELELHQQDAPHRRIQALLGDGSRAHEVQQQVHALLAAELVDAGIEQHAHAPRRVEVLDTPRAGGEHLVADVVVVDELPVGDHDAAEAELLPQQVGDDLPVVGEPDLVDRPPVALEADRHAVVRHHPRRAAADSLAERREVVLEHPARVVLLAAVREVRVLAVALGSAAGEVLRRARDRLRPERVALEALQIRGRDLRYALGVVAERLRLASPAGLGRQVDLRVQRRTDADGAVLLPGDVGEGADDLEVVEGSEAHRLRPLREGPGREGDPGVLDERVARVGADRHGDAVRRLLGQPLQVVAPAGAGPCGRDVVHVEVAHPLAEDHRRGRRLRDRSGGLEQIAVVAELDDRLEHQARLLLERQAREEVGGAFFRREARVLVGVHHPVAVEVAEPGAVGCGREGGLHRKGSREGSRVGNRDARRGRAGHFRPVVATPRMNQRCRNTNSTMIGVITSTDPASSSP